MAAKNYLRKFNKIRFIKKTLKISEFD